MSKLWIVTVEVRTLAYAETSEDACEAVRQNVTDIIDTRDAEVWAREPTSRQQVRGVWTNANALPWVYGDEEDETVGEIVERLGLPEVEP